MSSGGLSEGRLGRMHEVMAEHVERGAVPGIVTLIRRRGGTHVDVIGSKAFGGDPMRRDTIFRLTSMTKPVTAVAAMILIEESRIGLDEPVNRLLPELANRRVLKRIDGPLDDTVAAARPITVRDLLTFRMGLGMIWRTGEPYPIQKAIGDLGIVGFGPPDPSVPLGPDEWMRRLGTLPLMLQPGEKWLYNTGSYVLGVLIARAAGQPFETFLRERIFDPLGMKDTGFSVPGSKLDRLATSYWVNAQTKALDLHDGVADSRWSRPPAFPDGGAGLVSTIDDYAAFGQMMLEMGRYERGRILSKPSVELMTANHLTEEQKSSTFFPAGYWENRGWGFGVAVATGHDELSLAPGRYGWDGGYGTTWANDPKEEVVAVMMTQRAEFPLFNPVYRDFWTWLDTSVEPAG